MFEYSSAIHFGVQGCEDLVPIGARSVLEEAESRTRTKSCYTLYMGILHFCSVMQLKQLLHFTSIFQCWIKVSPVLSLYPVPPVIP